MYNFFSLTVVSFCIKEPLDFTRVPQIELKFSKFPGGDPHTPRMGGGDPPPLCAFFSRLNFKDNLQTNFLATTLGEWLSFKHHGGKIRSRPVDSWRLDFYIYFSWWLFGSGVSQAAFSIQALCIRSLSVMTDSVGKSRGSCMVAVSSKIFHSVSSISGVNKEKVSLLHSTAHQISW